MNIALWILQGSLAFAFVMAGFQQILLSKDKLKERGMAFVEDFSAGQVRLIGALEILGATGLVIPGVTGILPILVPLAAVGLALTMLGALITHARRGGENQMIGVNLVLMGMAIFVAFGRLAIVPL